MSKESHFQSHLCLFDMVVKYIEAIFSPQILNKLIQFDAFYFIRKLIAINKHESLLGKTNAW